MESLKFEGIITTTSNKQSKEFKAENPSKTAYVQAKDEENAELLKSFGLTEYSAKDNPDNKFFIIKLAQNLKLYNSTDGNAKVSELSCAVTEPNFQTDEPLKMNLVKGEKANNSFVRLNAILVNRSNNIQLIEAENPFAV